MKYFHGPMLWIFFGSVPVLVIAIAIDSEFLKNLAFMMALFLVVSSLTGIEMVSRTLPSSALTVLIVMIMMFQ